MTEAKFTSFTTCDFLNDVDLDIFIDALEKSAPIWVKEMKSRGLLRWSLNRVWNQNDVHRLVMSMKARKHILKTENILRTHLGKMKHFKKYVLQQNLQPLDA